MSDATAAVLWMLWPPRLLATFTVSSTCAPAPLARLPIAQVTICPTAEHAPSLGTAETNDSPAGSVSVMTALDAACGPLLVTCRL